MVRTRPTLPHGHGELLTQPPYEEWTTLAGTVGERVRAWDFDVAGTSGASLRLSARRELVAHAEAFSARLGVPVATTKDEPGLVVVTGHQPELYHPGVWIKDFLLQRFSDETGATALDLVVDSDTFATLGVAAPCMRPVVKRCQLYLAVGDGETCYACAPVPDALHVDDFCTAASGMLASLPAPAVGRHFDEFCGHLHDAMRDAENLSELVTFARRRYEASAGTDYLELAVTSVGRSRAFALFAADIICNARAFAEAFNAELADFRTATKTRSVVQPFPDLAIDEAEVELPLWVIVGSKRYAARVGQVDGMLELRANGLALASLPPDAASAASLLGDAEFTLVPRALALTLFVRMFVADLFIHGVGGGRYDRVTDGVALRYYGVKPAPYVVASMTMYLPLGAHLVTEEEVADLRQELNRLDHNPDTMLGEVEFDTAEERNHAQALAFEKQQLVTEIAVDGADKKALGRRIREVNAELVEVLAPLANQLSEELARLDGQRQMAEVLTDRTYPFCFWSPSEVADKAR
ncbi:MAG: hypothetical protein Q8K99_00030 [Actinomycetota bacterium]|nr:hypothetical protein [Actinomycetota bacterium]